MMNGIEEPVDFGARRPDAPKRVTIADAFRARRERGPLVHEPTGLTMLDRFTGGGLPYGTTVTVIGAPDAAKTLLALQIGHAYAKRGIAAGFMAIDEEIDDLLTRLVQRSPVESSTADGELIEKHFTRGQFENANDDMIELMELAVGELPLVYYGPDWTIEQAAEDLDAYARSLGKKAAFFVDSLQTATCNACAANADDLSERRLVTENAKAVRQVAILFHMITMATSESNREWSKSKAKGESASAMSAGAESRAVEFRARALLALSPVEGDEGLIEVGLPKNKLGGRAEPAFYLRLHRDRQILADADPPAPAAKPSGPSARQTAQRQEQEARRAETAQRKERERQDKQHRAHAEQAERCAREDAALRATLVEQPGVVEADVIAQLRARLGSCGDKAGRAIIARARLAGWLDVQIGPKNAKQHYLRETAPESP